MKFRLSLVLCLAAAPAFAQPAGRAVAPIDTFDRDLDALFVKTGLTAEQAAARAQNVSPTVARRIAEVDAAIAQGEATELQRLPQIGGRLSYTRLSFIPAAVIPAGGGMVFTIPFLQNQYLAEGSVSVPLSDYVLRYPKLIDAAHLGEEVARVSKRSAEVSASQDARLAYYEWVRSKLQVLIAQRQLVQVQTTLTQVRALAEVQRLSRADLLRVESQEAEAEQTVVVLQNLADLREEQLRLLIGVPEERLAIGEDIRADIQAPVSGRLDELIKIATSRRLEFRVLDTGIEAKEKQRSAEKSGQFPRLSAFAVVDYANPNPRVFPQVEAFKFTWSAGLQLAWTLNDTLLERTTDRRLEAETNELRADRENLVRGTRIELLAAEQAVQIAIHALATSQKDLLAAEEGYRVRKELLNAERATAVELVDAETVLTRARIASLNARVDLRVAMAQLAHALGEDTSKAK
ncbi:MAG: outer rane efflux protein [Myxococcales bacterium]|nr:outer rane efflux protein [Myxococcales bacterium]